MILIVGVAGGIASGIGVVFLLTPFSYTQRRRWSDLIPFGRRASDPQPGPATGEAKRGRRASDFDSQQQVNFGRRASDLPERAETPSPAPTEAPSKPSNPENTTSLLQCLTKLEQQGRGPNS